MSFKINDIYFENAISINTEHTITLIRTATEAKLFVDGILIATDTFTHNIWEDQTIDGPLKSCYEQSTGCNMDFVGDLKNIQIYPGQNLESEIPMLMTKTCGGKRILLFKNGD